MQSAEADFKGLKRWIHVHIGEYAASRQPAVIDTLLGSCVAVCLFDPVNGIGGMNHILLPGEADSRFFNASSRYGVNAMELLINRMMGLGADRRRFIAKVFGGGHMIAAISKENGMGKKNIAFAMAFLVMENIPIISKDVGGEDSRKIYYHTDTGKVLLKRVPSSYGCRIARAEALKRRGIQKTVHRRGNVTLFDD